MASVNDCVLLALRAKDMTDEEIRGLDLRALRSFTPHSFGYSVEMWETEDESNKPDSGGGLFAAINRAAERFYVGEVDNLGTVNKDEALA